MVKRKHFKIDIEPDEDFMKEINNFIQDIQSNNGHIMFINEYVSPNISPLSFEADWDTQWTHVVVYYC